MAEYVDEELLFQIIGIPMLHRNVNHVLQTRMESIAQMASMFDLPTGCHNRVVGSTHSRAETEKKIKLTYAPSQVDLA